MMNELRTDQWKKLLAFLSQHPRVYVGNEAACQRFIDGVRWIVRTGAQWRELPTRYGNWNSVYKRFARWCEQGIWLEMLSHFASEPDMEWVILDSSIVRAHPCAAGASKKTAGRMLRH